jgi:outer membrane PBP1 activator LpoA protein
MTLRFKTGILPLILFLSVACLLLVSCGGGPRRGEIQDMELTPDSMAPGMDPEARLRELYRLAETATQPVKKAYYTLQTAEWLMDLGRASEAEQWLASADLQALEQKHKYRIDLLQARLALAQDLAPVALQKLPQNDRSYPWQIQAAILRTRAIALTKLGYLVESLHVRLQLDAILQSSAKQNIPVLEQNHLAIWSLLQNMPDDMLQGLERTDPTLNGWIALTIRMRSAQPNQVGRDAALTEWLNKFKNHPAAATITRILQQKPELAAAYPGQLALLLPLGGRLAAPAKAIMNGLMAGYLSHDTKSRPILRVYDTGDDPAQIWLYYQQALQDGADMIIGPLHKTAVDELVNASRLKVPVLALNYSDNINAASDYVVQFGLLPEDEARQAAELAIIKSQKRALIFVPNNPLGVRLSETFAKRFRELGGEVLGSEQYSAETDDHGQPIQRGLGLLQSKNRNSILKSVLKHNIEFEPRRRSDVDAFFVVADPRHTRNLRAQLKFHDAGDVPVYATSRSFSGMAGDQHDRELDGIVFTDMPWVLQGKHNRNFATMAQYWPESMRGHARLYALGLDAYQLIPYLNLLQKNPFERFPGLTGNISLDENNRIHRESVWAKFAKGLPMMLEFNSLENRNLFQTEDDIMLLTPD